MNRSAETNEALVPWRARAMAVMTEIGDAAGVSVEEILGPRRPRHIASVRQDAMLAVRERLGLSFEILGELFQRDHTTVIQGCRKAERRRAAAKEART